MWIYQAFIGENHPQCSYWAMIHIEHDLRVTCLHSLWLAITCGQTGDSQLTQVPRKFLYALGPGTISDRWDSSPSSRVWWWRRWGWETTNRLFDLGKVMVWWWIAVPSLVDHFLDSFLWYHKERKRNGWNVVVLWKINNSKRASSSSSSSINLNLILIQIYPSLRDQTVSYIAQIQFSLINNLMVPLHSLNPNLIQPVITYLIITYPI